MSQSSFHHGSFRLNDLTLLPFLMLLTLSLASCSLFKKKSETTISISGKITLDLPAAAQTNSSVYVIVLRAEDLMGMVDMDRQDIHPLAFFGVDPATLTYNYTFSRNTLQPDRQVGIIAFASKGGSSQIPYPIAGDFLGIYMAEGGMQYQKTLTAGANEGVNITVSREMYDFKKKLQGVVKGDYQGSVTVIATNEQLSSSNIRTFDANHILGFVSLQKSASDAPFELSIFPYGNNLPIAGVSVYALYDTNGNSGADPGEKIGFYSTSGDDKPGFITLTAADAPPFIAIDVKETIATPSATPALMKGHIDLPSDYRADEGALFLVLMKPDLNMNISSLKKGDIVYFQRLASGVSDFTVDFSGSAISVGDVVMVNVMWDRGYTKGLPNADAGDYVGTYLNPQTNQPSYTLEKSPVAPINVPMNRHIIDEHRSIKGTLAFPDQGKIIAVTYAGAMDGMSFDKFDLANIVAMVELNKTTTIMDYQLDLLQAIVGQPAREVYVVAFVDKNGNGRPDQGDRIGFYTQQGASTPQKITLTPDMTTGIDIRELSFTIPTPSLDPVSIAGKIALPDRCSAAAGGLYLLVVKPTDFSGSMSLTPSDMLYYTKLTAGEFNLDMGKNGIAPGTKVTIAALCDLSGKGDFPELADGDYVGAYFDSKGYSQTVTLARGMNDHLDITSMRPYHVNTLKLKVNVTSDTFGKVTLFAYRADSISMDFSSVSMNDVLGYSVVDKSLYSQDFTLSLLPFQISWPQSNVMIGALYGDGDGGGMFAPGQQVGYVARDNSGTPSMITLDGTQPATKFTINQFTSIPRPSGYKIYLSGDLDLSATGYDGTGRLFLLLADSAAMDSGTMNFDSRSVLYFKRIDSPAYFACDLSKTAITPGQQVAIVALWSRDGSSPYPQLAKGDYIGIYGASSAANVNFGYTIKSGSNSGLHIELDRRSTPSQATVKGTMHGDFAGTTWVMAYRGAMTSMNPASITFRDVIGFAKVKKLAGAQLFNMPLLPFDLQDGAQDGIMLLAVYDTNGSGNPDSGDTVAFKTTSGGLPAQVSIPADGLSDVNLYPVMTIPVSAHSGVSLSGRFSPPPDYGPDSSGAAVAVLQSITDFNAIRSGPLPFVKAFQSLAPGQVDFAIDLNDTDLHVGDQVMVVAIWDKNSTGAMMNLSAGDGVAILQNTDSTSVGWTLIGGNNQILPGGSWRFEMSLAMVDHSSTATVGITDMDSELTNGDTLTLAAIQQDGLDMTGMRLKSLDYAVAFGSFTYDSSRSAYTLDVLPVLLPSLVFPTGPQGNFMEKVLIVAFVDKNGNGEPDSGEPIGILLNLDLADVMGLSGLSDRFSTSGLLTSSMPSSSDLSRMMTVNLQNGPNNLANVVFSKRLVAMISTM